MKLTETILRAVVKAIDTTNKHYVDCDPTVPMWTSSFARNLSDILDTKQADR